MGGRLVASGYPSLSRLWRAYVNSTPMEGNMDYSKLTRDELDELFAGDTDNPEIRAEYVKRGIDPDTGEPVAA